jgi:hypothetical protein
MTGLQSSGALALLNFTFLNPERRLTSDLRADIPEPGAAVPGAANQAGQEAGARPGRHVSQGRQAALGVRIGVSKDKSDAR